MWVPPPRVCCSRREAPPSPQMSNPVVEKASRRDPDEQLEFQGGELR